MRILLFIWIFKKRRKKKRLHNLFFLFFCKVALFVSHSTQHCDMVLRYSCVTGVVCCCTYWILAHYVRWSTAFLHLRLDGANACDVSALHHKHIYFTVGRLFSTHSWNSVCMVFLWSVFSKREQEKDLSALLTFSSRPSPKNVFSFKLCLKKKNDLFQLSAGGKKQTLKSHFL